MSTTQVWQVVIWSLLYHGKIHIRIEGINVNGSDVTMKWYLRANSRNSLKDIILEDAEELGKEALLGLVFTAILGDGSTYVTKIVKGDRTYDIAVVEIVMSSEKLRKWKSLLDGPKGMDFVWHPYPKLNGDTVNVMIYNSRVIDLARAILSALPPVMRDLMDTSAPEKWLNMKRIINMELKYRRGEVQIDMAGYGFTVNPIKTTVALVRIVKDYIEANEVRDALKRVYGKEFAGNIRIDKSGRYLVVAIPMYVFERYDGIRAEVIQVLCRKLQRTKDEEKRRIIAKHLRRLVPTESGRILSWLIRP